MVSFGNMRRRICGMNTYRSVDTGAGYLHSTDLIDNRQNRKIAIPLLPVEGWLVTYKLHSYPKF